MKKLWRKFRQDADRAIYEGRLRQFLWLGVLLLGSFLILLLLALVLGFNPREALADGAVVPEDAPSRGLRILELLLDPGAFVGSHNYGHWLFQLFAVLIGATIFTSFLIGAIGNILSRRVESITKGQYSYDFEDHIVILGASSILQNLLQQISGSGRDIAIQTTKDVEEVRETVMSYTDEATMKNIYVVFGNRTNPASLDSLHIDKAQVIYVLGEDDEPQHDGLNLKCWHFISENG